MLSYAAYFKVDPFPEGFPADLMKIERATAQNKEVPFEIEGEDLTLLKIPLGPGLNPKEQAKVTIEFSVKIPHAYGRFGWNENIMALSRWYPILSVYNEKGWNNHPFYPFHRPFFSEASNYSVELTVPQDQVVIHTGYLKNEQASGDRKTLFLETSLPVREFTMSMSPDYAVQRANFRDVRINSFYLPGDEIRGEEALENAKDLMAFYTDLFGEYAYKEFSIAPVFLGYGGEQMSNMIFIDTRVYKLPKLLKRHFDFLISHETGHQWFYNMVGIDEFSQI